MHNLLTVLSMFIAARKHKASFGQMQALLMPLATFLMVGMFLTALAALTVMAGLYGLYQRLVFMGLNTVSSGVIVTLGLIAAFIAGAAVMRLMIKRLQDGLTGVSRSETPILGQVGHVAESFISGLLQSQAPTVTRSPKA